MALLSDYNDNAIQIVLGYVSILFAFLIMSYFAANRLNKVHVSIVLVLFTGICFLLVVQLNLSRNLIAELNLLLQEFPNGLVSDVGNAAVIATRFITFLYNLITIGGYIGCIAFFFYQRKHGSDESDT